MNSHTLFNSILICRPVTFFSDLWQNRIYTAQRLARTLCHAHSLHTINLVKMAADKEEVLRSLEDNCTQHKTVYESCFNRWFRDDFLKGSKSDHQSVCGELFSTYQDCLKVRVLLYIQIIGHCTFVYSIIFCNLYFLWMEGILCVCMLFTRLSSRFPAVVIAGTQLQAIYIQTSTQTLLIRQ